MPESSRRRRIGTAAVAVIGLSALALSSAPAMAATVSGAQSPAAVVKKAHPNAMLSLATTRATEAWKKTHTAASAASTAATVGTNTLAYNGGTNGMGVMSGAKTKVYLVFYGNQWGTQGTDANGNATFSGDPYSAAPAAQQMFKGIGTNGETWSADLTQWCDGAGVTAGAYACPSNLPASQFVPYQSGGVLAGVWYDNAAASPASATEAQLTQEAINAAGHFGNTTSASNRNAYYVVLSPHGTNPDNYQSPTQGYCAWHSWNGDTSLTGGPFSSPYGNIAFSNQPYNMDMGATCGVNFLNSGSAGQLDGWTITLGHEWHEMMSDTYTVNGWVNPGTNGGTKNYENGDECAWIKPGQPGGVANVSFGSYGSYAEQSDWSNDTNSCAMSHAILTHGTTGNTVAVTNPGNQSTTVGGSVSLQVQASDSASGQTLSYSATGLPTGLSINSSTGLITGSPTTAGTSSVTVTVKDGTGATGSTTFSWTVAASGGGCTAAQLIGNGGFENGTSPWTGATGSIVQSSLYGIPAHAGSHASILDDYGYAATDTLAQTVSIPATCTSATFSFWRYVDTSELALGAADTLKVQVLNSSGTVLATLHTYSNLDADNTWDQASFSLSQFAGQTVTLKFTGTETDAYYGSTAFGLDDVALNVS